MGPPSYMRSVVDRNVVMRRMTVQKGRETTATPHNLPCITATERCVMYSILYQDQQRALAVPQGRKEVTMTSRRVSILYEDHQRALAVPQRRKLQ